MMPRVLMVLQSEEPIDSCLPKGQVPSPEGSSFVPTSSSEQAMRNCGSDDAGCQKEEQGLIGTECHVSRYVGVLGCD